jgi:DNA-binding transcriptional LysR family regulator
MKLTQIEYFLAAAEKLNFTAAAKALFISQPALSKQIKLIEEELGVRLFNRSKRKVSLTEAGQSFKSNLEVILKDLEKAVENAKLIDKKHGSTIRIGCFQGAAIDEFIYMISEQNKLRTPNIKLSFQRSGFREIREALMNDTVDIILTLDFEMPELYVFHAKTILTEKSALVYSEKSPLAKKELLSIDDFATVSFLVLSPEVSHGAYHNALSLLKSLKLHQHKMEVFDSWETLLTYLKMGQGFTIMFENVCNKMNGLRQFVVSRPEFKGSVVAIWKNESPLIRGFIDSLEETNSCDNQGYQ